MPANDSLHGGHADAGALELVRGVQALKHTEQLVRVRGVEARAVVANEVDGGFPVALGRELDPCGRALARDNGSEGGTVGRIANRGG